VLSVAELKVWRRMAAAAVERGTLTKNTVHGFALLCQCVVRRDQLEQQIEKDGWTYENQFGEPKRHPLWGVWQVVTLRVEQQLARFGLNGDGKAVPTGAPAEENPWAAIAAR
jgi:P27 family predicted phage terminase small subunit